MLLRTYLLDYISISNPTPLSSPQVMVWKTNFDRYLNDYVIASVQRHADLQPNPPPLPRSPEQRRIPAPPRAAAAHSTTPPPRAKSATNPNPKPPAVRHVRTRGEVGVRAGVLAKSAAVAGSGGVEVARAEEFDAEMQSG